MCSYVLELDHSLRAQSCCVSSQHFGLMSVRYRVILSGPAFAVSVFSSVVGELGAIFTQLPDAVTFIWQTSSLLTLHAGWHDAVAALLACATFSLGDFRMFPHDSGTLVCPTMAPAFPTPTSVHISPTKRLGLTSFVSSRLRKMSGRPASCTDDLYTSCA